MTVINAFHPDFMKTYYPDFMKEFRTHQANKQASATLTKHVDKRRKENPAYGTMFGISDKVVRSQVPSYMHRARSKDDMLKLKEFHTYAKAGMPKKKAKK